MSSHSTLGTIVRWWAFPAIAGLIAGVFGHWVGWWAFVLVTLGFVLGYHDPWNSKGRPR